MVVAQGPPGGTPDLTVADGTAEDRRGHDGLGALRQHRHRGGFDAFLGRGGGGASGALAELGRRELRIAQLEGDGEVALQPAVERIGENPGGRGGDIMEEAADVGRRAVVADFVEAGKERQLARGIERDEFLGGGERFEPFDEVVAGCQRATQRNHLVRGVGVGLRTDIPQVDAGLDAFIADPIGVGAFDAIVRECDLGQGDESAGAAPFGGGGAAGADEVHHRRDIGIVAGLPRCPIAEMIIRGEAGLVERGRLGSSGFVGATGDEPGGRKVRKVCSPDARPHGVAHRAGGGGALGDIGPRGGAAVWAGFLLEVRQRKTHGHYSVQLGTRRELLVHDSP